LARVATLREQLKQQNHNTYTILAGDAFSPSALGTAKVNGIPLAGQQMVAVMNAVGFDYATFGNHEFDISQESFLQRLKESNFRWFSGNVSQVNGQPFPNVSRSEVLTIQGKQGETVRVGLIGVTLDSNPAQYVKYSDPIDTAKEQVKALVGKVDIIVAITHLSLAEDQKLAAEVPEIALILGGHEHENIQQWRIVNKPNACQKSGTPIFKADANARTVYIHNLQYDTESKCLLIESRLQAITEAIPEDPATAKIVGQWLEKGFQAFRAQGFIPEEVVATTQETLDGLEASVRNQPTNLTKLIAQAMLKEVKDADVAIFNSGSIRIDDRLTPGQITQYDIIRILPFGGKVMAVEMPGEILQRLLNQGIANRGTGGYLQTAGAENKNNQWFIQGQSLDIKKIYKVAINDFLLSRKETSLSFLNTQAPGVKVISENSDIRQAVIQLLRN
jgi:5'-nucleotidase